MTQCRGDAPLLGGWPLMIPADGLLAVVKRRALMAKMAPLDGTTPLVLQTLPEASQILVSHQSPLW